MAKHYGKYVFGGPPRGLTAAGRGQTAPEPSADRSWYLTEVKHAEILLERHQFDRARAVLEKILPRLGKRASFERAAVTEQIGRCLLQEGDWQAASSAYRDAVKIAASLPLSDGSKRLQCAAWSGVGDAYRAGAHFAGAREAYSSAIALSKEVKDERALGIDLVHLGMLELDESNFAAATTAFRAALDIFQRHRDRNAQGAAHYQLARALLGQELTSEAEAHLRSAEELRTIEADYAGAAQAALQLAAIAATSDDAEASFRRAVDAAHQAGSALLVRQANCGLARHLSNVPGKRFESRRLLEQALCGVTLENFAGDVWEAYGLLSDLLLAEADESRSALLRTQALNFRQISQAGPRLHATLTEVGPEPTLGRAALVQRIARCFTLGNRFDLAIGSLREAIALIARLPPSAGAQRLLVITHLDLASALRLAKQPVDARASYARALAAAQEMGDVRAQHIAATCLSELAVEEGCADEAVGHARAALQSCRTMRDTSAQIGALMILGAACEAAKLWGDAAACYVEAVALSDTQGDADGAQQAHRRLAEITGSTGVEGTSAGRPEASPNTPDAAFVASLRVDEITDCVFGSDLVIDLGEETRVSEVADTTSLLDEESRLQLRPSTRTYLSDDKHLCVEAPDREPSCESLPECVLMRRARRVLTVSGPLRIAWTVLAALNGTRTVRNILSRLVPGDRPAAENFLHLLAATSMLDTSGRAVANFIHSATMKGTLRGGGLNDTAVVGLVTDGAYRSFGDAPHVRLANVVPESLRPFRDLTRQRRSRRDYAGTEISKVELSALLDTACGVTGTMAWSDGEGDKEVKLRAYPSSGALYAVEIYPVILRVGDLHAGVYHYSALENRLSQVREYVKDEHILSAILPTERTMVSGAAAMICLAGRFRRHEQKYGEGGYRMLVAEAGHISQTLVLAATALGLAARPFGGVFDQLLNRELGLDQAEEQFLLSVVVGHAIQ